MLQKVSIQNFKSLKDVTLELQKVNLLIGPNNSGKSNFLKALELWGKYISFQSEQNRFVKTINDLEELSFKKKKDNLKFEVLFDNELLGCNISSSVDGYSGVDYKILFNGKTYPASISSHDLNQHTLESSIFNQDASKSIRNLKKEVFEDIKIYKINPQSFINAQPISGIPNRFLLEDGSNMVAFLDFLKDEHKNLYRNLEQDLSKCIPEFIDINLKTVTSPDNDKRSYKKWGLGNEIDKYWSDTLSEGILYFLALLCIVHQPNPPKLLLLEEPEKGIHPRRIKEIIDFIFQLTEDKDIQVIMTTHSERVLDEFEDIPEAVFIFDKDEVGATQVKNLLRDIIEPSNKLMEENNVPRIKFVESLGSHWVTGFIGGVPK
ncbi:MAG: AAA family ATPase [Arcicella sp.]|nr:AAA family ATPase [Arcicella sp.]